MLPFFDLGPAPAGVIPIICVILGSTPLSGLLDCPGGCPADPGGIARRRDRLSFPEATVSRGFRRDSVVCLVRVTAAAGPHQVTVSAAGRRGRRR